MRRGHHHVRPFVGVERGFPRGARGRVAEEMRREPKRLYAERSMGAQRGVESRPCYHEMGGGNLLGKPKASSTSPRRHRLECGNQCLRWPDEFSTAVSHLSLPHCSPTSAPLVPPAVCTPPHISPRCHGGWPVVQRGVEEHRRSDHEQHLKRPAGREVPVRRPRCPR